MTEIVKVAKALSNQTRRDIINLLIEKKELNVISIADALKITEPAVSLHVCILEEAGLVKSRYAIGKHGVSKICYATVPDKMVINLKSGKIE